MATDIAFAVGLLSLFGNKVPLPLRVFLLALAIVDDLGAVLVIALFYSQEISVSYLCLAGLLMACLHYAPRLGFRFLGIPVLLGVGVWFWFLRSGVHATVAGVLLGFLMPLEREGERPLDSWVHALHPWMSFGVMPIFASANAGIAIGGTEPPFAHPVFWGVAIGLFLGKPLGILLACWLALRLRIAELPRAVGWGDVSGVAALGGIGFTMALFISSLALPPELAFFSKTGIIAGSVASPIIGAAILAISLRNQPVR